MISSRVFCAILLTTLAMVFAEELHDHHHEVTLPGKCPDFKPGAGLDDFKLDGDWFGVYCVKKGIEDDHDHKMKCFKETLSTRSDGTLESAVSVNIDGKQKSKTFVGTPAVAGKHTQIDFKMEAKDDHPAMDFRTTILDSDSKSYFVSITCGVENDKHGYIVQVFSKETTINETIKQKIVTMLKGLDINEELQPIEQSC